MSDGSAGWSILEGPFPDGSMVNKLLGAVIANIKRPNQNYKPDDVDTKLPSQCHSPLTALTSVKEELSLNHKLDVKVKLGKIFGVDFDKSKASSDHMTTKRVVQYSLNQVYDWFQVLSTEYEGLFRDMMHEKSFGSKQLYLITDIKVCQDALMTKTDSSKDSKGGNLTVPISKVSPVTGIAAAVTSGGFDPGVTVEIEDNSQNNDSSVLEGSRIFAIKYCMITPRPFNRSAWRLRSMPPHGWVEPEFELGDDTTVKILEEFPDVTLATLCDSVESRFV